MKIGFGLALVAATALTGCTTTMRSSPVEVTRFHLGAPLETGTLAVEPMQRGAVGRYGTYGSGDVRRDMGSDRGGDRGGAGSSGVREPIDSGLEFRNYANAVQDEALRHGFTPAATGAASQYIAVVGFNQQLREGAPRSSGLQIGLGGATGGGGYRGGGGVGLGGGVSFPIGRPKYRTIALTDMQVQIRRRSDQTIIWEGRAQTSADGAARDAQPDAVARKLAAALFQGFPGDSGRTITVK
ncbi:DUF4136 domain-containing protein [Sphingomonas sp. TREG-RG-20F-R18-01]|uniref:DUF4136 domain-containing protein n=1 Tax=Sphingomonas sp. TREG-RG-20F-R18-01 TaxID=2914982 RepID=UPI001F5A5983|nr:DUF4136 domain-containing protein [Sphingomonas sp. TREG-RG-20F-R18-01]